MNIPVKLLAAVIICEQGVEESLSPQSPPLHPEPHIDPDRSSTRVTTTLRRAASLVEGKALRLVKGSRRRKHMLYDVPVVGPQTIAVMRETGTTALSIDAGTTLLLDRVEVVRQADAAQIAIVAHPAG